MKIRSTNSVRVNSPGQKSVVCENAAAVETPGQVVSTVIFKKHVLPNTGQAASKKKTPGKAASEKAAGCIPRHPN